MWTIVLLTSITSPIVVWICLPFLRGEHARDDNLFGVAECHDTDRWLGICGKEPGKPWICARASGNNRGANRGYGELGASAEDGDDIVLPPGKPFHPIPPERPSEDASRDDSAPLLEQAEP
eukprot:SAG22_NODE_1581_length_4066_cov_1.922107_2_plen_121_part_00